MRHVRRLPHVRRLQTAPALAGRPRYYAAYALWLRTPRPRSPALQPPPRPSSQNRVRTTCELGVSGQCVCLDSRAGRRGRRPCESRVNFYRPSCLDVYMRPFAFTRVSAHDPPPGSPIPPLPRRSPAPQHTRPHSTRRRDRPVALYLSLVDASLGPPCARLRRVGLTPFAFIPCAAWQQVARASYRLHPSGPHVFSFANVAMFDLRFGLLPPPPLPPPPPFLLLLLLPPRVFAPLALALVALAA